MQDAAVVQTPVGIETFNAGLIDHYSAAAAPKIADNLLLSNLGSSDSDVLWTIGQGVTNFHESTVTDLRTALIHRQTVSIPVQMSHGPQLAREYSLRLAGVWNIAICHDRRSDWRECQRLRNLRW